jgi:hypothetical protein
LWRSPPGYDGKSSIRIKKNIIGRTKAMDFPEAIYNISPDFIQIYSQANLAEEVGLSEICGSGYRKALEFLIKDYIISKDSLAKEKIERLPLAKCISDYIKSDKIKEIAKRATWLGNDHTHYVRKWLDKNIEDLKLLIDLTAHWIEAEEISAKMIDPMPDPP